MQMLIVDDDREIVQLIPLLLPEYTFRQATSGKDALEWMRQAPRVLHELEEIDEQRLYTQTAK